MSRVRKVVIASVALLALMAGACVLAWSQIGAIVLFAVTPGVAFVDETPPDAPDYADLGRLRQKSVRT